MSVASPHENCVNGPLSEAWIPLVSAEPLSAV